MTTDPTVSRPEVDDPRVLALAQARQQLAYENPFNAVCPPWDGLSEQEQHLSLLDARSYLHAALRAGLAPAAVSVPPPAPRESVMLLRRWADETTPVAAPRADAARRERYAAALAAGFQAFDADTTSDAYLDAELLDAVVAVADAEQAALRAAVLREAIARVEDPAERAKSTIGMGLGWESAREVLRRMLHEQPSVGPCVAGEQQNETPEAETPTTTTPAASPSVVDEVVAALQAKAQALSVEAEEEMRRDLEDQAQVWHEAADLARRTGRKAVRNAQPTAKPETDGEGAATRFNWSDIIPAPVDETAQERDRLIDRINRVRVALRDCKERGATGMQYEIAVREAIGDREPRRGPGPLCHESDPRTLRECALKANHGGDHEDGDLSWPRSAEHQPAELAAEVRQLKRQRDRYREAWRSACRRVAKGRR